MTIFLHIYNLWYLWQIWALGQVSCTRAVWVYKPWASIMYSMGVYKPWAPSIIPTKRSPRWSRESPSCLFTHDLRPLVQHMDSSNVQCLRHVIKEGAISWCAYESIWLNVCMYWSANSCSMLDIAWLMWGIANVCGHLAGEHFTSGFVTQMSLVVSNEHKYQHVDSWLQGIWSGTAIKTR